MKEDLQNKLFEQYPSLFCQKDLPPHQSLMCYGIACGDGWYTLINEVCGNIQNHLDNKNRDKPPEVHLKCEAVQVKEKFGGLRFYVQGSDDFIDGVIDLAESISYRICSKCGNSASANKKRGWIYTLCDNCQL